MGSLDNGDFVTWLLSFIGTVIVVAQLLALPLLVD